MSTIDKLKKLQQSPEIVSAINLLKNTFEECDLKSHIRFGYYFENAKYEITFLKIDTEIEYATKDANEKIQST